MSQEAIFNSWVDAQIGGEIRVSLVISAIPKVMSHISGLILQRRWDRIQ
jgi:hypothetical protein